MYTYIHTIFYVQPEDGSKEPKRVADSCKFINYLITICVRLYCTVLYCVILHNYRTITTNYTMLTTPHQFTRGPTADPGPLPAGSISVHTEILFSHTIRGRLLLYSVHDRSNNILCNVCL
jgi:hypothetical protein